MSERSSRYAEILREEARTAMEQAAIVGGTFPHDADCYRHAAAELLSRAETPETVSTDDIPEAAMRQIAQWIRGRDGIRKGPEELYDGGVL
jgi:hypothetical protein